jgi:hypothetical protein
VDYPKRGIPATVDRDLLWQQRPRAHWRETKSASYHCKSPIGALYDAVIHRIETAKRGGDVPALAGRRKDKYGTILCDTIPSDNNDGQHAKVFLRRISIKLGFMDSSLSVYLLDIALQQKSLYEDDVLQLMNKYGVRGEGELFTGCIRKYHKLHKRRMHDVSNDVRQRFDFIQSHHRRIFFRLVATVVDKHDDMVLWQSEESIFDDAEEDYIFSGEAFYDASSDPSSEDEGRFGGLIDKTLHEELMADEKVSKGVERIVLSTRFPTYGSSKESLTRRVAFSLAGAAYHATYSPELQTNGCKVSLFSFPWILADVIASGVTDPNSR